MVKKITFTVPIDFSESVKKAMWEAGAGRSEWYDCQARVIRYFVEPFPSRLETGLAMDSRETLRLSVFLGCGLALILWEYFASERVRPVARKDRWPQNFSLTLLGVLVSKLMMGFAPVALSEFVWTHQTGLFAWIGLTKWTAVLFSVLLLDLFIYGQHRLFHRIPLFWNLHRVHHSDTDLDVTSGFRFHPIEILFSWILKCGAVLLLGCHPWGVVLFELSLSTGSLFNHSNIKIGKTLDRWLRHVVVTPNMHLVHHSIDPKETDSNFGFTLSFWDRLFGTYIPRPKLGLSKMPIGLAQWRNPKELTLLKLLKMPWAKP